MSKGEARHRQWSVAGNLKELMSSTENNEHILVLGVGNLLLGDEGVGIHVLRCLQSSPLPPQVECFDGGTGGLHLLGPMQDAAQVVLIDATCDGAPVGTMRFLRPRFSRDYPPSLAAHDIGLKDVLDAFYLTGKRTDVRLFAISIEAPQGLGLDLSAPLAAKVPALAAKIRAELIALSAAAEKADWVVCGPTSPRR